MKLQRFKSYVKFQVRIYSPIVAISLLREQHINVFNFVKKDDYLYEFYVEVANQKKVLSCFKEATIIKKIGLRTNLFNILFKQTTFICLILSLCGFLLSSNVIYDVKIHGNDEKINNLLKEELNNIGVKKYTFIPSFSKIKSVENDLSIKLNQYVELLEINQNGLFIDVKYIKRRSPIIIKPAKNNLYAKKNGVINKVIVSKGERVVSINDYVHKGDLLISGTIEQKDNKVNVFAEGKVYANCWSTENFSRKNTFRYDESVLLNDLLIDLKYKIGKDFTGEEKINSITILNKKYSNNTLQISAFISTYENIACDYVVM